MKILICSDTHRKDENLKKALELEAPLDMLIHLGDAEGSETLYQNWLSPSTRLIVVRGNNDFFSSLDSERAVKIGKYNCLLTHGHYYNVSLDMNGWSFYCVFVNEGSQAKTDAAALFVHLPGQAVEG